MPLGKRRSKRTQGRALPTERKRLPPAGGPYALSEVKGRVSTINRFGFAFNTDVRRGQIERMQRKRLRRWKAAMRSLEAADIVRRSRPVAAEAAAALRPPRGGGRVERARHRCDPQH
ncbi:hypothetical protein NDU88_007695 [Pleurodeles waltl]|uniref:Uncharacterized protein n=1 Tax=Pleurodeles waltl TaxID=8319 RepID=A0AAV7VQG7_PLEWA|nr:hypothetical protein NDU88_007695 [Pleurodeles waltl]